MSANADATAFVQIATGRTANLAAGGFENGLRRRQHYLIGGLVEGCDGDVDELRTQGVPPRPVGFLGFREDDQAFGSAVRVRAAEHGDAAAADAGDAADGVFKLMWVDIASAANDDVLDPAGEVNLAIGGVGAVAGIEPVAVEQALRLSGIAEISCGGRGALEFQSALDPLTHFTAQRVDNPHRVARQRAAAGDEAQGRRIVGRSGDGVADAAECVAAHAVDARSAPERGRQESDSGFGQPIDRGHCFGSEAIGGEALAEALHRFRDHRLCSVGGDTPGA